MHLLTRPIDEGNGRTLRRRGSNEEIVLQIARWSPDVERVLTESGASNVSQVWSWDDGNPVLARLAPLAPQIRTLVTSN